MDELFSFLGGILGALSFALAISNKIGDRFLKIELSIQRLEGKIEVQQVINKETDEKLEHYQNTSKEQVAHARTRFHQELDRLKGETDSHLKRLDRGVNEVTKYLAKNTDFSERDRD